MLPEWLPAPLSLNGTIAEDYAKLHTVFTDTILGAELSIENVKVIVDTHTDSHMPEYEAGFMHMVTRSDGAGLRTIDYERAVKLHWVPAIIQHYNEPEVYAFWRNTPKGETLYLWLPDHDYVVILKWTNRNRRTKIIVTAFSVDSHNRYDYQRYYSQATRIL